ncbi:acyl-CoA synthetase (AMP-forming)/AMP-acid ligase II [Amycolatopsis bartoniae]|uniref:AMP-dependent acyl-CoA synthetase n=1 Tax=Amycolatopsis bartoniae TaxID=941986 RepID=A0A8H9IVQ3_9PSEU|nr:AMP-binding protein [Amycolatopsis bartoniae]MBB2939445.1 acyl-CoA synthetase (AMP-forming)/AMP-acid ligase II [Amycolatopsis bartoniae]TVT11339.1 long-chain fatty acid--CoA ligase [Amycolatopsis bartoniae]GHF66861.1 AMP-dependent acyl-CoA synthetase [Amycolatopsis bartoniae]
MAIIDFFDRGRLLNPHGIAYRSVGSVWTFDEAYALSCRIAHSLHRTGVRTETKVAVLSPNDPLAWICVLGIWRAGATWVPLNPSHPVEDNVVLLDRLDVEVIIYAPALTEQVAQLRPRLPDVTTWVALGEGTEDPVLADWTAGMPETTPEITYDMDDVVAIAPTGGTTGTPKGVMNTHRSFSTMVAHQLMALTYPADAPVVNLAAAPMTHTAGLFSLQASSRGGTVVVIPGANADAVLDAIEEHGVTELFLPPTVIYRILERLEHRFADTGSLRYLMYAAAPMSVDKLRLGIERLGPVFVECYGQMEAPAAISFLRPDEHFVDGTIAPASRLSSCGRPYPLITVAIKDPATGEDIGRGRTGEVCVRGDLLMKGYYKDPERTAETIVDGWLHTGDLGLLDEQGFLRLTDRRRDLIISGGFNVYPGEVEQVLWGHPAVRDCAVVGAPHEDWGEMVTAVVELNNGMTVDEAELIALCRAQLGPVRTPKQVFFVDHLPRSANGKVLKKDVPAAFWANHGTRI